MLILPLANIGSPKTCKVGRRAFILLNMIWIVCSNRAIVVQRVFFARLWPVNWSTDIETRSYRKMKKWFDRKYSIRTSWFYVPILRKLLIKSIRVQVYFIFRIWSYVKRIAKFIWTAKTWKVKFIDSQYKHCPAQYQRNEDLAFEWGLLWEFLFWVCGFDF